MPINKKLDLKKQENLSMLCDFYELTMGNGYFKNGYYKKQTYFDVFFRTIPDQAGYAIAAGLHDIIEYVENLHFDDDDIKFLKDKNIFDAGFLKYLRNYKFTGDIYAVPEGTPVFPYEPLLTVRAPAIEAQLMETFILLAINHQSLIATKANRIVRAADGRAVMEFGSRRAQGISGAVIGARAAYIGGVKATACTLTDELYHVPAAGTMAHSWVQMFPSEYEAFKSYCELYPHNAVLLVDTYNTLKSGIPNAIKAFKDVLVPQGITDFGIRLDSGDLAYLTKKARAMLDKAGLKNCKIVVSNSLDEYLIRDLLLQKAQINSFGVGERLITSMSSPVFGGVYKLAAVEDDNGKIIPKIKISENTAKITNPGFKKVYRFYDKKTKKAIADEICLHDEMIVAGRDHMIFDPEDTWKQRTLTNFTVRELLQPIFKQGKLVYKEPALQEIQSYCHEEIDNLWDEVKRFENPHIYNVDLSKKLWNLKRELLAGGGTLAK
jgi:nicotinate phosphoribosyltransferase